MKTKNLEPLPDGVFSDCFELLTEESLQEAAWKSRWLIDNFLMSGSLNMIYASAGAGKSLLSLELAHFLAKRADISKVIYLDADNSKVALHRRGLGGIMKFHKKNNKKKKLEYYNACTERQFSLFRRLELIERLKRYQNSENAKRIETQTYIFTQALSAWLDIRI